MNASRWKAIKSRLETLLSLNMVSAVGRDYGEVRLEQVDLYLSIITIAKNPTYHITSSILSHTDKQRKTRQI